VSSPSEIEALFAPVTWNSLVKILRQDQVRNCGFATGSVVALTIVETPELAAIYGGAPIGAKFLEIEGPDGSSTQCALEDVELVER